MGLRTTPERSPGLSACAAILTLIAQACACEHSHLARVSDANVVVAGQAGGGIEKGLRPSAGQPLALGLSSAARCIPSEQLLGLLGGVCSHETENADTRGTSAPLPSAPGASAVPASPTSGDLEPGMPTSPGDLDPGLPKDAAGAKANARTREVRWYCDQRMDVRVVFEPCQGGLTPVEIAVAPHTK